MEITIFEDTTDDSGDIEVILMQEPTQDFTCPFCDKVFGFDADTAEMRNYARSYGCGCVPECILDAGYIEGLNKAQMKADTITVQPVQAGSYRNRAGFYITFSSTGKRTKIVPNEYGRDTYNIESFIERQNQ
jgi:hypothetical protein